MQTVFNTTGFWFIQFTVKGANAQGTLWQTENFKLREAPEYGSYKDFTTTVKEDTKGKYLDVSVGSSGRKIRFRIK
jgi:hypothetical protein